MNKMWNNKDSIIYHYSDLSKSGTKCSHTKAGSGIFYQMGPTISTRSIGNLFYLHIQISFQKGSHVKFFAWFSHKKIVIYLNALGALTYKPNPAGKGRRSKHNLFNFSRLLMRFNKFNKFVLSIVLIQFTIGMHMYWGRWQINFIVGYIN
jgi:hypothetical protein